MSALLAVTCAAAVTGSLSVGDRSEFRVRNEQFVDGTGALKSHLAADVDTAPFALMRIFSRRVELSLSYAPRFTVRQLNLTPPLVEVLQRAGVALAWRDRLATFSLGQEAAWGYTSFATLGVGQTSQPGTTPAPGAPSVERLPLLQSLRYGLSRTYFSASVVASRRVRHHTYLDYTLSGGTDASSRAALPFQHVARGEVGMDVTLTRRDVLLTGLRITHTTSSGGGDGALAIPSVTSTFFEQFVGARHRFTRATDGAFTLGVLELSTRSEGEAADFRVYPVAEASLHHLLAADHVQGTATARLSPVIDRITGRVDYQGQGSLIAVWTPGNVRRGFEVRTLVGVAESIPPTKDRAISVVLAEAALGYRPSRAILFEVGARTVSQRVHGSDPPPVLWVGFVTATIAADAIRF